MENRIITTDVTEEDYTLEGSLRPMDPGGVHRTGKNQKYPADIHRSSKAKT